MFRKSALAGAQSWWWESSNNVAIHSVNRIWFHGVKPDYVTRVAYQKGNRWLIKWQTLLVIRTAGQARQWHPTEYSRVVCLHPSFPQTEAMGEPVGEKLVAKKDRLPTEPTHPTD